MSVRSVISEEKDIHSELYRFVSAIRGGHEDVLLKLSVVKIWTDRVPARSERYLTSARKIRRLSRPQPLLEPEPEALVAVYEARAVLVIVFVVADVSLQREGSHSTGKRVFHVDAVFAFGYIF